MEKIKYISFDYSLSSPAMTVSDGSQYRCYAFSSDKKINHSYKDDTFEIRVEMYPAWGKDQQNRYLQLALGFKNIIDSLKNENLIDSLEDVEYAIEDYAFGAKGRVFHIAENTQMIKYFVWVGSKKEMIQLPPTSVKKIFNGKGTAKKEQMADSFKEKFGFYLHEKLGCKVDGTACDIVDSVAVNITLQGLCKQEIAWDEIFKKAKGSSPFGELKPLGKFKGLAKLKA